MDFRTVKDRNLFLDSKTIPRTFNALEAKLGTKNQKKRYNEVATGNNSMTQEKQKQKLKKRWVASQQALLFIAF